MCSQPCGAPHGCRWCLCPRPGQVSVQRHPAQVSCPEVPQELVGSCWVAEHGHIDVPWSRGRRTQEEASAEPGAAPGSPKAWPLHPRWQRSPPGALTRACQHLHLLCPALGEGHTLQHELDVVAGLVQPVALHVPAKGGGSCPASFTSPPTESPADSFSATCLGPQAADAALGPPQLPCRLTRTAAACSGCTGGSRP